MLPTMRYRCSCGNYDVALRQGQEIFVDNAGRRLDAGEEPGGEVHLVIGYEFDALCSSCGRTNVSEICWREPKDSLTAWIDYQNMVFGESPASQQRCKYCGSEDLLHPLLVTHLTQASEMQPSGTSEKEEMWWETYHHLREFFDDVDFRYPHYGEPGDLHFHGWFARTLRGGSAVVRSLVGLNPGASLSRWESYNARMRRRSYHEFFQTLPREFRGDFRLKQFFFMCLDNQTNREVLFREIKNRIDYLGQRGGLTPATGWSGRELRCPCCENGSILQCGMSLGEIARHGSPASAFPS
jgi:hypothetical protein